jgi:hypothetical protein
VVHYRSSAVSQHPEVGVLLIEFVSPEGLPSHREMHQLVPPGKHPFLDENDAALEGQLETRDPRRLLFEP